MIYLFITKMKMAYLHRMVYTYSMSKAIFFSAHLLIEITDSFVNAKLRDAFSV